MLRNTAIYLCLLLSVTISFTLKAQNNLIINTGQRDYELLNGDWQYIVDPYETGFYNYRYHEKGEDDKGAYWASGIPRNESDMVEFGYTNTHSIEVPGDWNHQDRLFTYYEGTVWYHKTFDVTNFDEASRYFIYFGAVNYEAHVYLNGKKLGIHKGGFTPFNFEIPTDILTAKNNNVVVKVDNTRHTDEIPTVNTDWWNYGGITRDVKLIKTSANFIQQYAIQLAPGQDIVKAIKKKRFKISGSFKLNKPVTNLPVTIEIPELKLQKEIVINGTDVAYNFEVKKLQLWSTDNPKLYNVNFRFMNTELHDKIGFRKIETKGKEVVLNGKPIFLRGISIHEEMPLEVRRAYNTNDAALLFKWAKELNVNMVRLAHYPHNEYMTRMADSLGILVWSEIPVYWTIDFNNEEVYKKAEVQLIEMIRRDANRASVIIWSVGNETPVSDTRTVFMKNLVRKAKAMDSSRLISAALQVQHSGGNVNMVDDPLGAVVDIVSINQYIGWYGGLPGSAKDAKWETIYDKPLFFSETGAGAKEGYHAKKEVRWSEEFQEWYYEEQVKMFHHMPDNFCGLSPWILVDFRSPKRNNPDYQDGWNRKGLISNEGKKKKAFYVLKSYYDLKEKEAGE